MATTGGSSASVGRRGDGVFFGEPVAHGVHRGLVEGGHPDECRPRTSGILPSGVPRSTCTSARVVPDVAAPTPGPRRWGRSGARSVRCRRCRRWTRSRRQRRRRCAVKLSCWRCRRMETLAEDAHRALRQDEPARSVSPRLDAHDARAPGLSHAAADVPEGTSGRQGPRGRWTTRGPRRRSLRGSAERGNSATARRPPPRKGPAPGPRVSGRARRAKRQGERGAGSTRPQRLNAGRQTQQEHQRRRGRRDGRRGWCGVQGGRAATWLAGRNRRGCRGGGGSVAAAGGGGGGGARGGERREGEAPAGASRTSGRASTGRQQEQ